MLSALLLSVETKELSREQYATAGVILGFIYGLLSAGNGAAVALVPMVVGGVIGFIDSMITGRPLRLPFAAGGAVVGFVITGVIFSNPIPVLLFTGIGLVVNGLFQ